MTAHERPVGATVEWYTPPELFEALRPGLSSSRYGGHLLFDLDPAAPLMLPPWVPANHWYSEHGETLPWNGRIWLNPPYGPAGVAFIDRMIAHGNGLLLLPARTETGAFQRAAAAANIVCFLRERLHFIRADGFQARSSFGSVLLAFGWECADALRVSNLGLTGAMGEPFGYGRREIRGVA
jgi:hypothetical protein